MYNSAAAVSSKSLQADCSLTHYMFFYDIRRTIVRYYSIHRSGLEQSIASYRIEEMDTAKMLKLMGDD